MHRLSLLMAQLAGWLLFGLLVLICFNVAKRYVFNDPIIWVDQVTGYFLVYITFLGAPWVLANRAHVSIEIVRAGLRGRRQRLLDSVVDVLGLAYCVIFALLALQECVKLVRRGSSFSDVIEVPQVLVYGIMPIGALLLALHFLFHLIEDLRLARSPVEAP